MNNPNKIKSFLFSQFISSYHIKIHHYRFKQVTLNLSPCYCKYLQYDISLKILKTIKENLINYFYEVKDTGYMKWGRGTILHVTVISITGKSCSQQPKENRKRTYSTWPIKRIDAPIKQQRKATQVRVKKTGGRGFKHLKTHISPSTV